MIKNKCDTCRNTFSDCSSDPVFVTEEEAAAEGCPEDTVKECDAYEPEHTPDLCVLCVKTPEHCGCRVENSNCPGFTDEEVDDDDDDDDDSWLEDDDDDEDEDVKSFGDDSEDHADKDLSDN